MAKVSAFPEPSGWHAGALIRDEEGVPTWRYRVEPFQEVVAGSGMTLSEVETKCGWGETAVRKGGYLSRVLGLRAVAGGTRRLKNGTTKRYPPTTATSLSYDNAVRIARALDLDLVEWEL